MQQFSFQKLRRLLFSALLLAFCGSFMLSYSTISVYASGASSTHSFSVLVPNITCTTQNNQSIYATYTSISGTILFRVGYEDTANKKGYGYCHVLAGHPEALPTIQYILTNGHVTATSATSLSIAGTYTDGEDYQVYIVTSNNAMDDGQMRGIVSAYHLTHLQ
jgi:hypothetical protein